MHTQAQNKAPQSSSTNTDELTVPATNSLIYEAVDLTCIRDDRCLFSELNFSLSPGQMVQIEGSNGSGKTSLLRLACGLSLPESGSIRWNGEDIQDNRPQFLANIAYIGHVHGVKSELTALENLRMDWALMHKPMQNTPMHALARVGLTGFEDIPCRMLSAGQRRRVGLARLLISTATFWILDEPLTSIDQSGHLEIESLLIEHLSRGGMVLLTSHQKIEVPDQHSTSIQLG
ncbi:cytochrome c biogenesis heme-transporting ATPase CcmA [Pseudomonadota bacterium]